MNKPRVHFSIFLLFFCIALIQAIGQHNWMEVFIFLTLGGLFIWTDNTKHEK